MPFLPALMIKPWAQWERGFLLSLTIENTVTKFRFSCHGHLIHQGLSKIEGKLKWELFSKMQPGSHYGQRTSTILELLPEMKGFSLSLGLERPQSPTLRQGLRFFSRVIKLLLICIFRLLTYLFLYFPCHGDTIPSQYSIVHLYFPLFPSYWVLLVKGELFIWSEEQPSELRISYILRFTHDQEALLSFWSFCSVGPLYCFQLMNSNSKTEDSWGAGQQPFLSHCYLPFCLFNLSLWGHLRRGY